mgnify:CR=1 FL=1
MAHSRGRRARARNSAPAIDAPRAAPQGRAVCRASTPQPWRPIASEAELFGIEDHVGAAQGRARWRWPTPARSTSTRSPICRSETQGKILRVLVDAELPARRRLAPGLGRRAHHLVDRAAICEREMAEATFPRGPLPSPECGAGSRAGPGGAARRHPVLIHAFRDAGRPGFGLGAAAHRRRCHGRAAGARLAGQRARAAQQSSSGC